MTMRGVRTIVAIGTTVVLLSGCAGALEAERDSPPPATPGLEVGGTVTVGITEPGALDPFGAVTPSARMISRTMCDTLVTLDPETNQVREGLVKSWVEAENGTYLTFRLAHHIKFSNGRQMKSQDLNASLRAMLSSINGSAWRGLALPFGGGLLGSKAGAAESLLVTGESSGPDPVQPLNDFDVQIQSTVINSGIVRVFAEPAMAPIDAQAYAADPEAFRSNPICAGPYKLAQPHRKGATEITLVRNEHYVAANVAYTGGGRGYADRIVFRIFESAEEAQAAYLAGTVDIAAVAQSEVKSEGLPAQDVRTVEGTGVTYVGFPTQQGEVWSNPVVRRALSMALDRRVLAADFGVGGRAATSFLPPSLTQRAGHSGQVDQPGVAVRSCVSSMPEEPDVEGARTLLKEAGIDLTGKHLLILRGGKASEQHTAALSGALQQWQAAFKIDGGVQAMPWPQISSGGDAGLGQPAAFAFSWSSSAVTPYPMFNDHQAYLEGILPTAQSRYGSNWSSWQPVEFADVITKQLAVANTQQTRSVAADRAQQLLCDELPLIPLVVIRPAYLVHSQKLAASRDGVLAPDGAPLLRELSPKK